MKYLNKIASVLCASAMGIAMLSSCEGSEMYSVGSPDWLQAKIDSIAETQKSSDEIEGLMEDVYTIGATDYSQGWWSAWSKYYQIPDGVKWYAQFNLNINPDASNTYKNFALIICNDENRDAGAEIYKEYGAIRFDNQPSGNSEWGDYIDRSCVESNLTFETDTDEGVGKLGGLVTLSIDRTDPNQFVVKMTNGTVTKTYTQKTPLVNLNQDPSNTKIRAFLVPEGSYIGFLKTTIEPIGGCTSAEDKQPLDMVLKNVPKKVLVTSKWEDMIGSIIANVSFETGVNKDAANTELQFIPVGDFTKLGTQKLCVVFNKTYKGENCANPIVKFVDIQVVEKMFNSIGSVDNTTPYQGASGDVIKIAPNETFVTSFTNYTDGAANWNNFLIVLCNSQKVQYCVARADNWVLDRDNDTEVEKYSDAAADWNKWLSAMNGAKVTAYITNNGDNTVSIKINMLGTDGVTYVQEFNNIKNINSDDCCFRLSVEKAHLEFDNIIGNEDNSSPYNTVRSEEVIVPAGKTFTTTFINNTLGANNWNNYNVVLKGETEEYCIARADNWMNFGDDGVEKGLDIGAGWDTWRPAMIGARVTLSVTNLGNDKANIDVNILGNDDSIFKQYYHGITVNSSDLRYCLTVDNCHLVFDGMSAVQPSVASAKKYSVRSR